VPDDTLPPASADVGLLDAVDELDCAAAEPVEDAAFVEEEEAEGWGLVVWPARLVDFAVVAGAAVELCSCVALVDLSLFGHKLETISPLKILPSSVELPTTTPPQLSRTPLAIWFRPETHPDEHGPPFVKSPVVQDGIVRSYAVTQASETLTVSFWKSVRDNALARGMMRCRKLPMSALFRMMRISVAPEFKRLDLQESSIF
jgi:hypothetical protein